MIDTGIDLEHKDLNVDVARSANSWVIGGVDYVAANAASGDAANISLGGPPSAVLDEAVLGAADKGINFLLAAGNSGKDANNNSPAISFIRYM